MYEHPRWAELGQDIRGQLRQNGSPLCDAEVHVSLWALHPRNECYVLLGETTEATCRHGWTEEWELPEGQAGHLDLAVEAGAVLWIGDATRSTRGTSLLGDIAHQRTGDVGVIPWVTEPAVPVVAYVAIRHCPQLQAEDGTAVAAHAAVMKLLRKAERHFVRRVRDAAALLVNADAAAARNWLAGWPAERTGDHAAILDQLARAILTESHHGLFGVGAARHFAVYPGGTTRQSPPFLNEEFYVARTSRLLRRRIFERRRTSTGLNLGQFAQKLKQNTASVDYRMAAERADAHAALAIHASSTDVLLLGVRDSTRSPQLVFAIAFANVQACSQLRLEEAEAAADQLTPLGDALLVADRLASQGQLALGVDLAREIIERVVVLVTAPDRRHSGARDGFGGMLDSLQADSLLKLRRRLEDVRRVVEPLRALLHQSDAVLLSAWRQTSPFSLATALCPERSIGDAVYTSTHGWRAFHQQQHPSEELVRPGYGVDAARDAYPLSRLLGHLATSLAPGAARVWPLQVENRGAGNRPVTKVALEDGLVHYLSTSAQLMPFRSFGVVMEDQQACVVLSSVDTLSDEGARALVRAAAAQEIPPGDKLCGRSAVHSVSLWRRRASEEVDIVAAAPVGRNRLALHEAHCAVEAAGHRTLVIPEAGLPTMPAAVELRLVRRHGEFTECFKRLVAAVVAGEDSALEEGAKERQFALQLLADLFGPRVASAGSGGELLALVAPYVLLIAEVCAGGATAGGRSLGAVSVEASSVGFEATLARTMFIAPLLKDSGEHVGVLTLFASGGAVRRGPGGRADRRSAFAESTCERLLVTDLVKAAKSHLTQIVQHDHRPVLVVDAGSGLVRLCDHPFALPRQQLSALMRMAEAAQSNRRAGNERAWVSSKAWMPNAPSKNAREKSVSRLRKAMRKAFRATQQGRERLFRALREADHAAAASTGKALIDKIIAGPRGESEIDDTHAKYRLNLPRWAFRVERS